MAYTKEEIYNRSLKAAENENVYFIEDVVTLVGISKPTFYVHIPVDSDEMNDIKAKLSSNRVAMKVKLRERLSKGEKAAEILALYKLIATDDERKKLSMQHHDHTTKGEKITEIRRTIIRPSDGNSEP